MFVAASIYNRSVQYIDLPDQEAFKECLQLAIQHMNPDATKEQAPVVFASVLSKQTPTETGIVQRKLMTSDRARRKFIMLDVDYEPEDEEKATQLIEQVKKLSASHKTPTLIYPTLSWPHKPRFRIVFFTKRVMGALSYHKAVQWLARQLDYVITDPSDTRLSANRNLPWFSNQDQIDGVYHTLNNTNYEPLDNKLWSDEKVPRRRRGNKKISQDVRDVYGIHLTFDPTVLTNVLTNYAQTNQLDSYDKTWRLIESIADEVLRETIPRGAVMQLMDAIAAVASDQTQRLQWATGNMRLFEQHLELLQNGSKPRSFVRPLLAVDKSFSRAVMVAA